ncbi:unnamed protein product [Fraxinus pennsylvanica]|uniref:DUF668 domain-containing protein n=1 Tax=Fraxinus pennsylvanica TaxID=56036 RepID=A0AAD1Z053_9LAMI|nr:unnamed protein product [Fraxinus pennsylvanica]
MDGIGELGVYQICGTGSETLKENWFGNIWRSSRKGRTLDPQKPVIGILAFEVSRLMLKVVNIWQCLGDQQIVKLREEIVNSIGIQKLVSRDKDYLMDLVLAEIFENLVSVAKSVDILGKKCEDPLYNNLERVFDDPGEIDPKWIWWQYRLKKMERKVKKMEKFIASTEQLYQELEELAKLEQSLRQMRAGVDMGSQENLYWVQRKVVLQRLEVKNLQETSPWVRTHDYIVRLLLRSLFTILERIKHLHRTNQIGKIEDHSSDSLIRGNSVSARMQLSVYTSENKLHSSFSDLAPSDDKIRSRNKQLLVLSPSSIHSEKSTQIKGRQLAPNGFKGLATGGNNSPVKGSYTHSSSGTLGSNDTSNKDTNDNIAVPTRYCGTTSTKQSFFNSKRKLLNAPPATLGNAALALHYANVILIIKKLASAPELISDDSRDDLYNMLPTSIRNHLSAKLKVFSKSSGSMTYDASFREESKLALARTLEWLSPLALDTIRWHSVQNFERHRVIFGSNVLLVQTLHFAKQVKTEAAIFELLMGLNYLSRFRREIKEKTSLQSSCNRACDGYILSKSNIYYSMIDDTSL